MANTTRPFAAFEWMIAWRYMRARRAEGGVSVMTWISLLGVTLAVFALIATFAIRTGFRADFVDTLLGANAHVTVYAQSRVDENGNVLRTIDTPAEMAAALSEAPGVTRAAPLVRAQVLATNADQNAFGDVFGISAEDIATIPLIANPDEARGDLSRFGEGVAIGSELARSLGLAVGDRIRLTSPNGNRTPLGITPRVNAYEVVYIFKSGSFQIDQSRVYLPLEEAQLFFNRDGVVDEIEVMIEDPEALEEIAPALLAAAGPGTLLWTWQDRAGSYLRALEVEDNVMFVLLSILILIAAMNIISGLIMLVKNKGRDIGILRTMGLTEGSILRIFFLCGAGIGTIGTIFGVILGSLFAIYIDPIFSFVNSIGKGDVWDPSVRGIYQLPARLELADVLWAMGLSLGLSWVITIFPARRAARMNPVEALRYE